jgi:DNA-binding transcriptional regulator YdaS (Cro superfamily)
MDLRTYLFFNRITQKKFSEQIGYQSAYIGLICQGRKKPGRKLAKLIELATEGQVKYQLKKDCKALCERQVHA